MACGRFCEGEETNMLFLYGFGFVAALVLVVLLTPFVIRLAHAVGAVDRPNERKVHTRIMPRLGGLAIFLAFAGGFLAVSPVFGLIDTGMKANTVWGILIGGAIIVLTGALDDRFDLKPKYKLLGIVAASLVVVAFDMKVEFITLPFVESGHSLSNWLSIPITIFWIVGVTNAINLIDGLDGLAAGVSAISVGTILALAVMMGNVTVILLCAVLLGSAIGFLFFNFHPAKIFMGDSGALFLGFAIATLSILGFKQATLVSFVVPLFIIAIPFYDTMFAIIRRKWNGKPWSAADKNHLHHCLMRLGLSHRQTVLAIYGLSLVFGLLAILLSNAAQWVTVIVVFVTLFLVEVGGELIGIMHRKKKPVLSFMRWLMQPK
jgi:UDP-GlcNAc:undecaprenyl-phosphate GlcNAc-1-phosphate transferase